MRASNGLVTIGGATDMASQMGYVTAAQLRNRCVDVDTSDYSDADLDTIITKKENKVHYMLGQPTATPYTTSDAKFEMVKDAVLEFAACEVFGGLVGGQAFRDSACEAGQKSIDIILNATDASGGVGSGSISKTNGFNNYAE